MSQSSLNINTLKETLFKFSLSMNTLQAIEHHFFIIISETSYRCLNLSHQSFPLALKDARLPCRTADMLIRKRICFSLSILECINFAFKILFHLHGLELWVQHLVEE